MIEFLEYMIDLYIFGYKINPNTKSCIIIFSESHFIKFRYSNKNNYIYNIQGINTNAKTWEDLFLDIMLKNSYIWII